MATTTTTTRFARRGTVGTVTRTRMVSALVALSIGVAGLGLTACGTEPSTEGYETVSYAGENPFTPPVGTDDPDVTPVEGGGGEQGGDTDGLYAQNPDAPSCDPAKLVSELQGDEARARAWAEVLGIEATEIEDFVKSLTPVTLRSATAVTNYSYADGTYRAAPATLAPGTAVFVNVYGEPTVKCYSGNPLTRGTSTDPAVTTVTPARSVITHATYVNPTTNAPVTVENKPSKEALAAAAKSARATAERAATVAKGARSNADLAKKASDAAATELATSEKALTTAEAQRDRLKKALENAIKSGKSLAIIKALHAALGTAEKNVETAAKKAETARKTAAEKKAEHARLEELAKRTEEASKKADEEARQKEKEAGLPSPAPKQATATGETPATPDKTLAVEEEQAVEEEAPAEPEAEVEDGGDAEQAPAEQAPEAEAAGA
jgi:hypothetical protein